MREAPLQEGTAVIPRTQGSFWIVGHLVPQLKAVSVPSVPSLRCFNQLHNSLNGGSAGQGGIEDGPPPPALVVDALLADAAPLADAEPLLPP